MANTDFIKDLKFDDRGLIPAVAQDATSGEILMLAYMNEESIKMTLESGHATYFSRSSGLGNGFAFGTPSSCQGNYCGL